jgi:hypothetical protein
MSTHVVSPEDNTVEGTAKLLISAALEASTFFGAVKALYGLPQAQIALEDWLNEFEHLDWPTGCKNHSWRHLTHVAAFRLAERVGGTNQASSGQ